MTAVCTIKLKK